MTTRDPLDPLVRDVGDALSQWPEASSAEGAALLMRRGRARRRRRVVAGVVTGLALAASLLLALRIALPPDGNDPPIFRLRGGPAVAVGEWIGAEERALVVDFDRGTELATSAGSRLQIARLSAEAVEVKLAQGRLKASIAPNRTRRWTFISGPYRAEVLGTVFELRWQRDRHEMALSVERGSVRVRGGKLPPEGRVVSAGYRLDANKEGATLRPHGQEPVLTADASAPSRPDAALGGATRRPPVTPKKLGPAEMRWRALAKDGKYRAASKAARSVGLSRLLRALGAADLLLLADTLRLGGMAGAARSALSALERRFPRRPEAATAACRLGRMAFDKRRYTGATAFFQRCLRRAPRSRLAGGARGRLMLCWRYLGQKKKAQAAARAYRARHAKGPYAAAARAILEGKELPKP